MSSSIIVPLHPADLIFMVIHGKRRAKAVPPETDCFVADIDAALVQKIFQILKRNWEPNNHHHRKVDDLW